MSVGQNATALPNGGLNAKVQCMYQNGSTLYMGGNFTSTADDSVRDLNSLAAFDIAGNAWHPVGAGVNGTVYALVPLMLNITAGDLEDCLTVNGDFTSVNAFGNNPNFDAQGFAIWVPGRNNWLHNLADAQVSINGMLVTMTDVPGFSPLYGGQITSQALGFSDAVALVGSGQPTLQSLGIQLHSSGGSSNSSSKHKRAIDPTRNSTGVYQGLFYSESGLNITVLGGNFAATASDGSTVQNLMFINNTETQQTVTGVSGLDSNSIFAAMDTYETSLFAGGAVTGTVSGNRVNGLIVFDLKAGAYATTQPPALAGNSVIVNAVAVQPKGSNVYVGGDFVSAGSLPCAALCYYDTSTMQWNNPGTGLGGVVSSMVWSSNRHLIIAGDLTIGGAATTMATYDSKAQTFQAYTAASTLPGPITALAVANSQYNEFWAAGTATSNGSAYLSKYSGNAWTSVSGLDAGTTIRGLQVMSLTSNHARSDLVPADEILFLTGNLALPSFGNASAVLFNGTTYQPFILTSRADGTQGSVGGVFSSRARSFMASAAGAHLALGLVVLIGLAISLFLIGALVSAGVLMERQRRKREGYVPMAKDKGGNLSRIPPESLLGGLNEKEKPPVL